MHLLGQIDRLEPHGKGAFEIARLMRFAPADALLQVGRCGGITLSGRDGQATQAFDQLEQFIVTLVAQHLTNEASEHMHVVTQRRVLGWKIDFGTTHRREFTPAQSKGRATRVARPLTGRSPD